MTGDAKSKDNMIWRTTLGVVVLISTCGCMNGTVHQKASGTVQTENKLVVEHRIPVCENYCLNKDGGCTHAEIVECAKAFTQLGVKVDTSDEMADLLETLSKQDETTSEPQNTLGGI
jgi:hypothetical protein